MSLGGDVHAFGSALLDGGEGPNVLAEEHGAVPIVSRVREKVGENLLEDFWWQSQKREFWFLACWGARTLFERFERLVTLQVRCWRARLFGDRRNGCARWPDRELGIDVVVPAIEVALVHVACRYQIGRAWQHETGLETRSAPDPFKSLAKTSLTAMHATAACFLTTSAPCRGLLVHCLANRLYSANRSRRISVAF